MYGTLLNGNVHKHNSYDSYVSSYSRIMVLNLLYNLDRYF